MEPIKIELGEDQTIEGDVMDALNHLHVDGEKVTVVQEDLKRPKIVTITGILARKRAVNYLCTRFKVLPRE